MKSDIFTGPWRVDNRTLDEGACGFVVAEVYTCFGGVTVRAEKSLVPMPKKEDVDALGEANAKAISAVPDMVAALLLVRKCSEWSCMDTETQDALESALNKAGYNLLSNLSSEARPSKGENNE